MIIITDSGNVITVQPTKSGGRKTSIVKNNKVRTVYTHPSRANSVNRLIFDIRKLEKMSS